MTTRTLPPDPDGINNDRAAWAQAAIDAFEEQTGSGKLGDLICDLMHWADRNGVEFYAELDAAEMHYRLETADEQQRNWRKDELLRRG